MPDFGPRMNDVCATVTNAATVSKGIPVRIKALQKSFARMESSGEDMLPPGQQRSPGCFTLRDRLFKIKQGFRADRFSSL